LIAKFYRGSDGSEPVDDFINALPIPERASVAFAIELLNELTDQRPHLPFPNSSQVEGEHANYAAITDEQFIVLLHIFRKDTAQIPESE